MVIITEQSEITAKKEHEAEQEAFKVRTETAEIEKLKLEAESELQAAVPALEAANKAVDQLSKDEVTELKGTKVPPALTEQVIKCVLIYLGYTKIDWATSQKAMADINFLQKLKNYDKENIPQPILTRVKDIFSDKNLKWDQAKITNTSKSAGGLAKWCSAIYKYAETLKVVRPKEQKVAEMQQKFQKSMLEVEA